MEKHCQNVPFHVENCVPRCIDEVHAQVCYKTNKNLYSAKKIENE